MRKKYLRCTDLHLNRTLPFGVKRFIKRINSENASGLFITGDITSGSSLERHLTMLGQGIKCPIYFVLGNHDFHGREIEETYELVRNVCSQYTNLRWLSNEDVISLNDEVAIVGTEGWYDIEVGNPWYIRLTSDWFMIPELFSMITMNQRLEYFRAFAATSADFISKRIDKALEAHSDVIVLTHVPPWAEMLIKSSSLMENFWLPYNSNIRMGKAIEETMVGRADKHCTIYAGHTHIPAQYRVSNNTSCSVLPASSFGLFRTIERIYI